MGCFSWKYCDSNNRMICGKQKLSFLLIPKEFGGGHIIENCYKGYGKMASYDIYEVVAEWNRKYLSCDILHVPNRNDWNNTKEGQLWYERAMKEYEDSCLRLQNFIEGKSEDYMVKTFGPDWKREIGINISCDDQDNKKLKYPIKIAENKTSVYENCNYSKRDPLQGCY